MPSSSIGKNQATLLPANKDFKRSQKASVVLRKAAEFFNHYNFSMNAPFNSMPRSFVLQEAKTGKKTETAAELNIALSCTFEVLYQHSEQSLW